MSRERERLSILQQRLPTLGCEALILEDPISLYYLTGLHVSTGSLVVCPEQAFLLLDGRYAEGARERSFYPVVLAEDKALEKVVTGVPGVKRVGVSDTTSYRRYEELRKKLDRQLIALPDPLMEQRAIKDPEELRRLRAAGRLGAEGFDLVCSLLREGITELEIAAELEIFWRRNGGKKLAFDPIIAFEPSSSEPHYSPRPISLRQGQSVLIDIGVNVEDYHSDMTRVVFFGEPNPQILKIYEIVKQAQAAALQLCHPGTTLGELDAAARDLITAAGYGESFPHSLGHGIGLEIHEWPRIRRPSPDQNCVLKANMVITIEPGIYLPGIGGVRLEDTVVITESGYEDLTQRSK